MPLLEIRRSYQCDVKCFHFLLEQEEAFFIQWEQIYDMVWDQHMGPQQPA